MRLKDRDTRTPDEPMAFTPAELWRGARNAWCIFMMLMLGGLVLMIVVSMPFSGGAALSALILVAFAVGYAGVIGGGIGLIVMLAGAPLAGMLGRALRREPRVRAHLMAYGALGLLLGGLTVCGALMIGAVPANAFAANPLVLIIACSAAVSVPLGWWSSARRALREDRGTTLRRRAPRPDPDALAEDAL